MGGNGVLLLLAAVLGFAALHFALRQRRLRRQLSQAAQQLAVILDGGSDEALLVPLCDDALTPLLGQIDRLLLEKKKLCVQQRRARLAQRRMLANMAHDLRTPLTVLLGQLEIARLRGEESETLRRVQAKAEEVLALSEAFFTLSKLEAGDTKLPCAAVDLSELCRAAALEYYDFLTQQRFEVEIHVPEEACPVWGHEESIRRILSNLISNAVRYGAAGRYLGIVLEQQEDGACVRVQDRGQGIAPEVLGHATDRLYTPEDSRGRALGGSGLGLAIAKGLAEGMGGTLWAESTMGKGTMFVLKLLWTEPVQDGPERKS